MPIPATGGGAMTRISASWITENLPNSEPMMAAEDCCGSLARSAHGSSTRKIAPAFGALVKVAPEKPTMFTACATPGVLSAISTARCCTSSVRESEAPGGSWTTTIR